MEFKLNIVKFKRKGIIYKFNSRYQELERKKRNLEFLVMLDFQNK